MPDYIPDEELPIYPTYTTIVKDGVKYKAYFETDWHQVITEDGVPLCDLIKSMPSFSTKNFYRYRGTFKSTPESTGLQKLYAVTGQINGDVYLVETEIIVEGGRVCESYVWLDNEAGWVYCGTTNKKATINNELPGVVKLFPNELGEPGQGLVVAQDGRSMAWGSFTQSLIHGENGDALLFNEADGGGAKFTRNDGLTSFVGVNDGSGGISAQVYSTRLVNGKWTGARIDVKNNGIYYTVGDKSAAERDIPENEIATKKDITTSQGELVYKTQHLTLDGTLSTDYITQGTKRLILNGGSASI